MGGGGGGGRGGVRRYTDFFSDRGIMKTTNGRLDLFGSVTFLHKRSLLGLDRGRGSGGEVGSWGERGKQTECFSDR